jgi:DNA end-binding protein Ku
VRSEQEYFDEIQDVKVTKGMLDLARHIVNQKAGRFAPEKFEDHYETALIELINQKRAGKPITPKEKPAATNVVNLMEALRRSVGQEAAPAKAAKPAKKARKAAAGQKGDADVDCRQEGRQGDRAGEAGGQVTAEICLTE